tara:strand:+ start:3320 stop:3487 length:168 start_codon:yes stop_codon:yes gene_type:complete
MCADMSVIRAGGEADGDTQTTLHRYCRHVLGQGSDLTGSASGAGPIIRNGAKTLL